MKAPHPCRLCHQLLPLCNSHIIPEFGYEGLYDDGKHRFVVIHPDPSKPVQYNQQKGLREQLLCQPCESRLSIHEKYVSEWIETIKTTPSEAVPHPIMCEGLDYKHLRLFFISLLWRMGIAQGEYWSRVTLGPHEERLRHLVNTSDPGEPTQYPLVAVIPLREGKIMSNFQLQPHPYRDKQGCRLYRFSLGRLLVSIFVTNHYVPRSHLPIFLQPNGSWMLIEDDMENLGLVREWWHETIATQRIRKARGID